MFTMEITRLIERCRQGDADALGELYKAYAQQMRGRVPTLYQRRADGGGCAARRFRDYLHFVRQAARRATGRALDDGHHEIMQA